MTSATLTVDSIAELIADQHTELAARFIDERAHKLYYASYSRGTYGRIMLPLLKKFYPTMNWNGASTSVALAITRRLEARGYGFYFDSTLDKQTFRRSGGAA